ncbi:MAG: hypothetical protein HY438_00575 [DPANN group archaeon]|nr:hypothetical protein [DPANN group archaeon]
MLKIKKGNLFLYYCFDVAYEIKLDKVETVFGKRPETSKLVCERMTPGHVQYKVPPLLVKLGRHAIKTKGVSLEADIKAKIYNFGVVTVIYQIPFSGDLSELAKLTSLLAENKEVAEAAKKQVAKLVKEFELALDHPQEMLEYWEDYLIASVKEFDGTYDTDKLIKTAGTDIARVLRCETGKLSRQELENSLKYLLTYYEDELVAVDWQAAFIYDPRQSYDVFDVLEDAVIELLELRAYDDILDKALEKAYDDLEKPSFSFRPHARTLHDLTEVKLDVTGVMAKVNDALKLIGDLYLAKVYKAAAQRFYLADLQASLNEKLKTIESIYQLLFERANNRVLIFLEALIVGLFVLDIILLFVK